MSTSIISRLPVTNGGPFSPAGPLSHNGLVSPRSQRFPGVFDNDSLSNGGVTQSYHSRRVSSKRFSRGETTTISNVVSSLKGRSSDELGPAASAHLFNASHTSVLAWIRNQRMSLIPPEGSDYDKVLAWAQLFVERLQSFDEAIEDFAGDSFLAAQLAYGYCSMLLELGLENAAALTASFGFFYSISMSFLNLLERTELFGANHEIRDQLVRAFGDLVSLVASVSTHFHKAIHGLNGSSISIDIYRTFPDQIQTFRQRCEKASLSLWRHQLLKENIEGSRVAEIESIKSWLAPDDRVIASVVESTSHLAQDREELTCLWIGPYLARFLKSQRKNLAITGTPGSGKTVLASVVVDHLQHAIGGLSYNTIYIPINGRIPASTTSRAVASSALSQLLANRIGNVQLFQVLSDAFKRSTLLTSQEEYDDLLWTALDSAMAASLQGAKDLVVVVDGIDESISGESMILQKLLSAVSKASNAKLITFGAESPAPSEQQACVQIDKDLVFDDIAAVTRSHFQAKGVFSKLDEIDQETLVNRITEASRGSFLWAKLAVKHARTATTHDDLHKAVETLVSQRPSTVDFVVRVVQTPETTAEAKHMLLWLATAERPLKVSELAALTSVQVDKLAVSETPVDVLHILKPLISLIFVQDDLVYLRHGTIRAAVLDVLSKGKLVTNIKDHHADLVTRMLVYVQATDIEPREPSLNSLSWHDTNISLNKYPLLEFALRYWPLHFGKTAVFQKDGPAGASKSFSKILPASTTVSQLQNTLWETLPTSIVYSYWTIVLNVFRKSLTSNNVATLQSTIFMAQLLRQLGKLPEAIPLFYQASITSHSLLTAQNIITMQLMRTFLDLTADQVSTSKTDIMVQRGECLVLLVECYKVHYGATSESVVTILKQLWEHYHMIKEVQKAREIEVSIQSITHTDTGLTEDVDGSLAVKLRGRDRGPAESGPTLVLDTEYDEKVDSGTLFNFESLLQSAQKSISEGRYDLAERIYVEIWQRANDESRRSATLVAEEGKIKATLDYIKFLMTRKRDHEASSILSSFWQDSQHLTIHSETSVSYLQEIAKALKTVGLTTMALAIFKSCSEYYQSTNQTHSSTYKDLEQHIHATSQEVMQSISSSSTVYSESTLEEMVYEATHSITTVDQTAFNATDTLIQLYVTQHRWREATRLVKRVLRGIWPSLFAASLEDVTLPAKHAEHCVSLAERLCQCYRSRRRSTKEGDIRFRIYRALRAGRNLEDKLRQRATTELIRFYDTTSQTDLAINVHKELLNDYTQHYGPAHAVVVRKLWTLADLTRPRPVSIDYYQQIIQILNKGSKTCHPEAFEPVITVSNELWVQGRYSDAVNLYKLVFTAFLEQDKLSPKFKDTSFVQEIFNRYTHCLRSIRTDFTTLHNVTTAYQTKCKTVFGMSASITVQATLTLAKLCQESKRYETEAIVLYEELLKIKSDVLNHNEISATLDSFYEEQAALASTSNHESLSSAQVQQAMRVLRKRITTIRQTYGWAHEVSLSKMREMISLYSKHNEVNTAVSELNEATVQVLTTTASVTALATAAVTIASSYIAVGHAHKVTELSDEIYRQVIMKDTSNAKGFKFDLSSKEHHGLVFLAQLKYHLRHSSSSVTEILAALTTEYIYFEEFRKQIRSQNSSLLSTSLSASRLYQFLISQNRRDAAARVLVDLTTYFLAGEGKRIQLTDASQVQEFLSTMLSYLSLYSSHDFTRSVGIAGNARVVELLKEQKFEAANNVAIACFKYISAQKSYHTPAVAKFVFTLGMHISGRGIISRPKDATHKTLIATSSMIIQNALSVVRELKLNLALMDPKSINGLLGLLGEQEDRETLSWLLALLWNSREVQRSWPANTTLALGRRFIMARYLVGDTTAAVRLAEDVVYNCRRVHGVRHASTLDMSVLLSQLYTGIAQKYQAHKDGAELANRYYKKSASTHENILRALSDPALADLDTNLDSSMSLDGNSLDLGFGDATVVNPGERAREHFNLLKLAVERLGDWPKDYAEYQRLNADLFREYPEELKGFEGVEKWNLKSFGGGKAESNQGQLDAHFNDWQILDSQHSYEWEEEL